MTKKPTDLITLINEYSPSVRGERPRPVIHLDCARTTREHLRREFDVYRTLWENRGFTVQVINHRAWVEDTDKTFRLGITKGKYKAGEKYVFTPKGFSRIIRYERGFMLILADESRWVSFPEEPIMRVWANNEYDTATT